MSFVPNDNQQISLFDTLAFMSERKQRILEKSWAKAFSEHIFTKIDEHIFMPLYSEKTNSRPNAPINVIVGALILKDFTGLTDDEILEECEFDLRYQYALHTTCFEDQPLSDRTFSRFRARCAAYELTTGKDLIHECFVSLAEELRVFMDIAPNVKRMDSMMIESNIRKMGRLELLYTCLANLVQAIHKNGGNDLLEGLEHYWDPNDRNKVIYHDKEAPQSEKLQEIIDDACELLPKCEEEYGNTADYQLLERAINEQTKPSDDGGNIPKTKDDDMDSSVMQNPSDPDATYRKKAGRQHRGYSANLTETVSENGSVITDYQYDTNNRSDNDYLREFIENTDHSEECMTIYADGAYSSKELQEQAGEKNIEIITTDLIGRKPRAILSEFKLTEDKHGVVTCPAGKVPKSSSYNKSNNMIRISFYREQCEYCPNREACLADLKVRTAVVHISLDSLERAKNIAEQREKYDHTLAARIRNGVETVPSLLRNKYQADNMPVRGKIQTKHRFGFKVFAANFSKLLRHINGQQICRAFEPKTV